MAIREIKLPEDLGHVSSLLSDAFVYPDNPEWSMQQDEADNLGDTVNTIRMLWPVFNFLKIFSPKIRDSLLGYLWEEDGEPVALVTVSRRGTGDSWMVGNVGVLPEFRRRGIARQLVNAGLDLIRRKGGNHVVLEVLDGNLPAFELYKELGFENFSDYGVLIAEFAEVPPLPKVPEGFRHQLVPMRDWKTSHDLAKKLTPQVVQQYDPITKSRYYTPAGLRIFVGLIAKLRGTKQEDFALRDIENNQVVALGYSSAEVRAGRHSITMILGEEHAELIPFMLDYMLYMVLNLALERKVEIILPEWREFARMDLERKGFEEKKRWQRMGMQFEG